MAELRVKCPSCKTRNVLVADGLDGHEVVGCSSCHKPLGTWAELQEKSSKGIAARNSKQVDEKHPA